MDPANSEILGWDQPSEPYLAGSMLIYWKVNIVGLMLGQWDNSQQMIRMQQLVCPDTWSAGE
jgi:hypothetical protein